MRNTRLWITALAAACLLSACKDDGTRAAADGDAAVRKFGAIAFEPCTLASPMAPTSIDAQCAKFDVAEIRRNPQAARSS